METSKQQCQISLDSNIYDQWQSVGLAEGLLTDTDIAKFLIQVYDINKKNGQLSLQCLHCTNLIGMLCDTCKLHQTPPVPTLPADKNEGMLSMDQEHGCSGEKLHQSVEQTMLAAGEKSVTSQSSIKEEIISVTAENGESQGWSFQQVTALKQYVADRRCKRKTHSFWQACASALNAEFRVSWAADTYKTQYSKEEGAMSCCVKNNPADHEDNVTSNSKLSEKSTFTCRPMLPDVGISMSFSDLPHVVLSQQQQEASRSDEDDRFTLSNKKHSDENEKEERYTLCNKKNVDESFATSVKDDSDSVMCSAKRDQHLSKNDAGDMERTTYSSQRSKDRAMDIATEAASSELTWHYLGVTDVDIPDHRDAGRKRTLHKRSLTDRFKCKDCASCFSHRSKLVQHIRMVHLKWRPHLCQLCSTSFPSKNRLNRHVNVVHAKVRPFCCETCGASFVDHYTLSHHKLTHKENRQHQYFCEQCGKGYHRMGELKQHMETHTSRPVKSLLCWVCGKAVRTTRYLRIHLRTHSPDSAHTCTECHQVFTSKHSLENHRKSLVCTRRRDKSSGVSKAGTEGNGLAKKKHAAMLSRTRGKNSGTFQCEICEKFFSVKKDVYRHKRNIHGVEVKRKENQIFVTDPEEIARFLTPRKRVTTDFKFSCEICFQQYSSQENVRKHKDIVHFGRRDYSCELCKKTFTRASSLKEHKDYVHNPNGVECDICHKTFSSKTNMIKHKKVLHYGFKPHSCPACSKTFRDNYKLRKHQQSCRCIRAATSQQQDTVASSFKQTESDMHASSLDVNDCEVLERAAVSGDIFKSNTCTSAASAVPGFDEAESWTIGPAPVMTVSDHSLQALGVQSHSL